MGGGPLFSARTGFDFLAVTGLLLCFLLLDGGVSKMEVCCCREFRILLDLLRSGGVKGWTVAVTSCSAPRFLLDLLRAREDEETEDWDSSRTGAITLLDLLGLIVDL